MTEGMTDSPHPTWLTPDDFYLADPRRESSLEVKLPGGWYGEGWGEQYELYYLTQTGEVVAIATDRYQAQPALGGAQQSRSRPVELICWCETEALARRTFSAWSSHQGTLKSLYWLRQACRQRNPPAPAIPGDQVGDEHRDQAAAATGSLF